MPVLYPLMVCIIGSYVRLGHLGTGLGVYSHDIDSLSAPEIYTAKRPKARLISPDVTP